MPTVSVASVPISLPRRGEWVLIEEIWKSGFWVDSNREMEVPRGVTVTFRHNMWLPPWHWEVTLREGRHGFAIIDGWNKFQVRLESAAPSGVLWIL